MKYKGAILFCCLILFNSCGTNKRLVNPQEGKQLFLFLCIGQSNMAGRAELMPEDTLTIQNVFLFNDSLKWETAKNPLNRYSNIRKDISMQKLGLSWTFAKTLSEAYRDKKIGLVVNARGGSSLSEWEKGSEYYEKTMMRAKEAQKTGIVKGLIWHQGESDHNKAELYTQNFARLVTDIRNDLGVKDLPVVVGEIGHWKENSKKINLVISELRNHIEHLDYVATHDLKSIGDDSHFDSDSQRILGQRYAIKFLELTNRSSQ